MIERGIAKTILPTLIEHEVNNVNEKMLAAGLNGDLATVEELVMQGANINHTNAWGKRAIFSAAWEGNLKALDLFYDLGAIISFDDANLLCNAAYNRKVDSVKWLSGKGENANFSLAARQNDHTSR